MDSKNGGLADFHTDIAAQSLELDMFREYCFVEEIGEILVEAGELDDCVRTSYKSKGLKVDGYTYDEELGLLSLVIAHYIDENDPAKARVTNSEVEKLFKRCLTFFKKSLRGLYEKIEISNETHDLARLIYDSKEEIQAVNIILITDGVAPKQSAITEDIDGVDIRKVIWDIDRILGFIERGEREAITVNFEENGGPVTCLSHGDQEGIYTTYLAYVPGQSLADLYSTWGTRMLDMNVRVFLSARGKVNKGIRETIINDPDMFCAYNNGITVFARSIETENLDNGTIRIIEAKEFQIVNGGQTVASLYHASKKQKADLSKILVQMKLIVINSEDDIGVLVPRISEYSNTQNRVNLSDLAANNPPHPELHDLSKNIWAPDPTGGSRQTHWFYEKARGSYEEIKRLEARTPAQAKKFEARYPKKQKFDKSIFGKSWNTYLRKPHDVSLGAQKNFVKFNMWLRNQEEDLEEFFKKTVALVLLWKTAEKIVRRQSFEGYRHNIVTYTLAWMFELTEVKIDLYKIWREQTISEPVEEAIEEMCQIVNEHIRETTKNVTEWCKKKECWENLKDHKYKLPAGIEGAYIDVNAPHVEYDPRIKEETETIGFCEEKGHETWWELAKWLKERKYLTPKARSQCGNMARTLNREREPSYYLARACKKAWEDAGVRGWKGSKE